MTKADLVERVTAQISRTAGPMISKKDCARVVDAFLEAIKESLQSQENIEVRGFGSNIGCQVTSQFGIARSSQLLRIARDGGQRVAK